MLALVVVTVDVLEVEVSVVVVVFMVVTISVVVDELVLVVSPIVEENALVLVVSEVADSYVELNVVGPAEPLEVLVVSSADVLLLVLSVAPVQLVLPWEDNSMLLEVERAHLAHSSETSGVVKKVSVEVVVSHGQI